MVRSGRGLPASAIAALFTRPVSASVADARMYELPLALEEATAVARAVEKRRREFTAGRACARAALAGLGSPARAIPVGPDRAPVWPAGFVGSITHCDGFCCAVAAGASTVAGLGVDAEDAGDLTDAVARYVLRPDELAPALRQSAPDGASWPKLAFSAKEAVYKCLHPVTGARLAFHDVAISFSRNGAFETHIDGRALASGVAAPHIEGRWRVFEGRVYAGATATPRA
jgi:4'-phosphopantetheinyl transferase EntD